MDEMMIQWWNGELAQLCYRSYLIEILDTWQFFLLFPFLQFFQSGWYGEFGRVGRGDFGKISIILVYVYDCVKRSLGDTNEMTNDILHVFSNGKFIMTIH